MRIVPILGDSPSVANHRVSIDGSVHQRQCASITAIDDFLLEFIARQGFGLDQLGNEFVDDVTVNIRQSVITTGVAIG